MTLLSHCVDSIFSLIFTLDESIPTHEFSNLVQNVNRRKGSVFFTYMVEMHKGWRSFFPGNKTNSFNISNYVVFEIIPNLVRVHLCGLSKHSQPY